MTASVARALLALLALAGAAAALAAGMHPLARVELSQPRSRPPEGRVPDIPVPSQEALRAAGARPIFRADRRRSSVAYNVARTTAPVGQEPAPVPKPALAVSGIVWGPDPAALVEGLPGVEGSAVLRKGDSRAGVRVLRIEGERVVLRGFDTTWTLAVRNPWR